jgi:hypothetical protein
MTMQPHSCQLKVQTPLPQLANRVIQQILVELQAIKLVEQARQYSAQGLIRREIRYAGSDGRVRKIDDQLQFEVKLGECKPDQVALAQTELCQDYFVFQPQPSGNGQPILEQGLNLRFQPAVIAPPQPVDVANWWLNLIVKQGSLSRLANFTVSFPRNAVAIRDCAVQFVLDTRCQAPLLSGVLKGTIGDAGCGDRTFQFEQTASFLVPELPAEPDGELTFIAQVKDVVWQPGDVTRNEWYCEVILEFKWYLTKPAALTGLNGSAATGLPIVKLMTIQPLAKRQLQFERTITLAAAEKLLTELKVALQSKKEEWAPKGLLLTANLQIEMFYVQSNEAEAYQQWKVDCCELVRTEDLPAGVDSAAQLNTTAKVAVEKYGFLGGQLRIELVFTYDCRFGQNRLVEIVRDPNSTCKVLALVQTDRQVVTVCDQAEIVLRERPARIHAVKAALAQVVCAPQNGKVKAQGQQEIVVTYCDSEHRQRTDLFRNSWRTSFIWDTIDPALTIICQAKLAFNRYTTEGQKLLSQNWWELQMVAARLEEVPIALGRAQPLVLRNPASGNDGAVTNVSSARFQVEQEIRLDFGISKAIEADRTSIGLFYCRQAGQALLVSGRLDSELEYWDQNGVLRQERRELPFWQFVPCPPGNAAVSTVPFLQPQIRKCIYQPLKTRPWAKGRLKLLVEVELQLMGGGSEPDEDLDAKSD